MALVIPNTQTQPTLTTEQKQQRTAARIKSKSTLLFNNIVRSFNDLANELQANPDGLSPTEAAASLQTADLTEYLQNGAALKALVNSAIAGTIPDTAANTRVVATISYTGS